MWGGDVQPTSLIEAIYPPTETPVATPSCAGQPRVSLRALTALATCISWSIAKCSEQYFCEPCGSGSFLLLELQDN